VEAAVVIKEVNCRQEFKSVDRTAEVSHSASW
jgi:hypothetical protein